ncbi:MAG: hypothetical protein AAF525_05315 [Pseudomonadota bacterium]
MSDENRELVSAFMDGEASEIEIHKLLRQYKLEEESDTSNSIRDALLSFGKIKGAVGLTASRQLDLHQHQTLHQSISDAIADDDTVFDTVIVSGGTNKRLIHSRPFQATALAACLVVAVGLVGITMMEGGGAESPVLSQESTSGLPANQTNQARVIDTQTVATASDGQPELRELDEERQRELREYLNRHGQDAARDPNVQTVGSDNTPGSKD